MGSEGCCFPVRPGAGQHSRSLLDRQWEALRLMLVSKSGLQLGICVEITACCLCAKGKNQIMQRVSSCPLCCFQMGQMNCCCFLNTERSMKRKMKRFRCDTATGPNWSGRQPACWITSRAVNGITEVNGRQPSLSSNHLLNQKLVHSAIKPSPS